jgi:hypothetical protein
MTPHHEGSGSDGWTERYEQLRQHALGEAVPRAGGFFGLEALLQKGMAVWMRAVPTNGMRPEETGAAPVTCGWLAASQRETTLVLAEMTLPLLFQMNRRNLNGR